MLKCLNMPNNCLLSLGELGGGGVQVQYMFVSVGVQVWEWVRWIVGELVLLMPIKHDLLLHTCFKRKSMLCLPAVCQKESGYLLYVLCLCHALDATGWIKVDYCLSVFLNIDVGLMEVRLYPWHFFLTFSNYNNNFVVFLLNNGLIIITQWTALLYLSLLSHF